MDNETAFSADAETPIQLSGVWKIFSHRMTIMRDGRAVQFSPPGAIPYLAEYQTGQNNHFKSIKLSEVFIARLKIVSVSFFDNVTLAILFCDMTLDRVAQGRRA